MAEIEIYLPRSIRTSVDTALSDTPVVSLLGPRQVGKSTLVQRIAPDRPYLNLDQDSLAETAAADPGGFVDSLPDYVTLDEVQRVPDLMRAIKVSVDRDRRPGRFLLTGSANLLLLPTLTESLAGRMEIIRLHPLTESEKEQTEGSFLSHFLGGDLKPDIKPSDPDAGRALVSRLLTGGYPEAHARSPARARTWHRQYLQAIVERDVQEVANIRDVDGLARTLQTVAHQSAQLLNVSQLSKSLALTRATVDHYLTVLNRLFLLRLVPAWHRNKAKRLVKSPKAYIPDSGLAATLVNLRSDEWNTNRKQFGAILESFVIQQLVAQAAWTDPLIEFFHYRDKDQVEVDCVITRGDKVWGVEVKESQTVRPTDGKGLRRLRDQAGNDFEGGIVLYNGESTLRLGDDKLLAVPLSKLWTM